MCRICFGDRGWETQGCWEEVFFPPPVLGMLRLQQASHRSMKRMIMHEPLTQWKWVWIPDTWLVVVSVLLIYSHLGCMTAAGEIPWKHSCAAMPLVYNTLHVACVIWKCWFEWQEKSRVWCNKKISKQSPLAQRYQAAFVTIFKDP